jgi:hypothetical protein
MMMVLKSNNTKLIFFLVFSLQACYANPVRDQHTLRNQGNDTVITILNNNRYKHFPIGVYDSIRVTKLVFSGSECDIANRECSNIKNLPDGIKKLENLQELYLVMNDLRTISDEVNQLKKLTVLDLSENSQINIDNLKNDKIKKLILINCGLTKIPKNIYEMKSLEMLVLNDNPINPDEIKLFRKEHPLVEVQF